MAQNLSVLTPVSRADESPKKFNPPVDYLSSDKPFVVVRFIVECGQRPIIKSQSNGF
jgi:hypothetical protein